MNELDRYAVSLENMEVLRAQVAELEAWKAEELALMNPLMDYARSVCTGQLGCSITEWLVEDHKAQAREIERLQIMSDNYCALLMDANQEIAALKSQPSGVVLPELKKESAAWGYDMGGNYDEGHADGWNACLDEIDRLNHSAKAGDGQSEDGLEEWAKGKFGIGGRYIGKLYGNTDWALARAVWSAALSSAVLSANHSELVRQMVPDGWCVRDCEDSEADLKGFIVSAPRVDGVRTSNSVWPTDTDPAHRLLYELLAAAPSAGSQKEQE